MSQLKLIFNFLAILFFTIISSNQLSSDQTSFQNGLFKQNYSFLKIKGKSSNKIKRLLPKEESQFQNIDKPQLQENYIKLLQDQNLTDSQYFERIDQLIQNLEKYTDLLDSQNLRQIIVDKFKTFNLHEFKHEINYFLILIENITQYYIQDLMIIDQIKSKLIQYLQFYNSFKSGYNYYIDQIFMFLVQSNQLQYKEVNQFITNYFVFQFSQFSSLNGEAVKRIEQQFKTIIQPHYLYYNDQELVEFFFSRLFLIIHSHSFGEVQINSLLEMTFHLYSNFNKNILYISLFNEKILYFFLSEIRTVNQKGVTMIYQILVNQKSLTISNLYQVAIKQIGNIFIKYGFNFENKENQYLVKLYRLLLDKRAYDIQPSYFKQQIMQKTLQLLKNEYQIQYKKNSIFLAKLCIFQLINKGENFYQELNSEIKKFLQFIIEDNFMVLEYQEFNFSLYLMLLLSENFQFLQLQQFHKQNYQLQILDKLQQILLQKDITKLQPHIMVLINKIGYNVIQNIENDIAQLQAVDKKSIYYDENQIKQLIQTLSNFQTFIEEIETTKKVQLRLEAKKLRDIYQKLYQLKQFLLKSNNFFENDHLQSMLADIYKVMIKSQQFNDQLKTNKIQQIQKFEEIEKTNYPLYLFPSLSKIVKIILNKNYFVESMNKLQKLNLIIEICKNPKKEIQLPYKSEYQRFIINNSFFELRDTMNKKTEYLGNKFKTCQSLNLSEVNFEEFDKYEDQEFNEINKNLYIELQRQSSMEEKLKQEKQAQFEKEKQIKIMDQNLKQYKQENLNKNKFEMQSELNEQNNEILVDQVNEQPKIEKINVYPEEKKKNKIKSEQCLQSTNQKESIKEIDQREIKIENNLKKNQASDKLLDVIDSKRNVNNQENLNEVNNNVFNKQSNINKRQELNLLQSSINPKVKNQKRKAKQKQKRNKKKL